MSALDKAGGVFRWTAGAVAPMFARPTSPVGLAWFVHVVLVALVVVGGYFLQTQFTGLYEFVRTAWLKPYWLPALLVLLYALLWAVAWLLKLLAPNQPTAVYPDLDEAWDAILVSLQRAGIGLADTPVVLVLGDLPNGFEPLFRSLPNGLAVAGGSPSGSPLRAFANRDAVYVTVCDASLLGFQGAGDIVDLSAAAAQSGNPFASVGVGQSIGVGMGGASISGSIGASIGGGSIGASMTGGGPLREIQRIIQGARDQGRPLTDAEKERVRVLSGGGQPQSIAPAVGGSSQGPGNVLQNPRLVEEATGRLSHVCGRIAASRWPLCPVNGLILAVPAAATERDEYAQQWGLIARHDLDVIESTLKLQFPVFAVVGGVEGLPGGAGFFDTFALDKGNQRLGKGFPFNPDANPEAVAAAIETTAGWVFGGLLSYWALKQTRVGGANDTDANAGLIRFLDAVRRRGPHLGRLLSRAVAGPVRVPTFGGVYLTVVPPHGGDALFAKEFFRKVESAQAYVAWTADAYAADAGYRRAALLGHVALAAVLLSVVALGVYAFAIKGKA